MPWLLSRVPPGKTQKAQGMRRLGTPHARVRFPTVPWLISYWL